MIWLSNSTLQKLRDQLKKRGQRPSVVLGGGPQSQETVEATMVSAEYGPLWRRLGWLVCFFYAAAAALRLARFNSRAATQDKHYFEGLPSPSAAAIVAAFVWLASDQTDIGLPGLILAFLVTACAGALMISRFAFHSFKQVDAGGRVRFTYIIFVPLAFVLLALHPQAVLLLLFGSYALSAPLMWVFRKLRRRSRGASTPA